MWGQRENACGSIRNQRRSSLRTTIREAERRDHDDDGCGGRRGVEVFISTVERWLTCSLRLHTKLTISADEDQTERPDQTRPGVGARRLLVVMSWVLYTYTYGRYGKLMCVLFCISTIPGRWAIRARCLSAGAQDAQALYRVICLFGYIWPRMRLWKNCILQNMYLCEYECTKLREKRDSGGQRYIYRPDELLRFGWPCYPAIEQKCCWLN